MDGTTISTIVTAISTVVYTGFTGWLIWESRKMRKSQEAPQLDIFVERSEDWASKLNLIIRNNGFSGAYEISLAVNKDINILSKEDKYSMGNTGYFKYGIAFLAPQTQRDTLFTILSTNFEDKIKWKAKISATYKTIFKETIHREFIIDLSEFENTILPTEPPLWQISKSLKNIENNIDKISRGSSEIHIISQTKAEKRKEDKEFYAQFQEAKEK